MGTSLQSLTSGLFHFLSQDVARLAIFAVGGVVFGVVVGRGRLLILSLATYIALALVTNAPWISFLQNVLLFLRNPYSGLIWFGVLYTCTLAILWRSHWLEGLVYDRGSWWEASVLGLVQLGCTLSCVLLFLPDMRMIQGWAPVLVEAFGTVYARSFWLSAPLLLMALRALPRAFGETRDLSSFRDDA